MTKISGIGTTETSRANIAYIEGETGAGNSVKFAPTILGVSGFRARKSGGTQAISIASLTKVTFDTEDFDPDGVFSSSTFTVPAAWNNRYAILTAGLRFSDNADCGIYIRNDTTGTYEAQNNAPAPSTGNLTPGVSVSSGLVKLTTGDQWIVHAFVNNSAETIVNDRRTFFSAAVF